MLEHFQRCGTGFFHILEHRANPGFRMREVIHIADGRERLAQLIEVFAKPRSDHMRGTAFIEKLQWILRKHVQGLCGVGARNAPGLNQSAQEQRVHSAAQLLHHAEESAAARQIIDDTATRAFPCRAFRILPRQRYHDGFVFHHRRHTPQQMRLPMPGARGIEQKNTFAIMQRLQFFKRALMQFHMTRAHRIMPRLADVMTERLHRAQFGKSPGRCVAADRLVRWWLIH